MSTQKLLNRKNMLQERNQTYILILKQFQTYLLPKYSKMA